MGPAETDIGKTPRVQDAGMVSLVGAIGVLVIIAINTAIAAVGARFFRVRMSTQWGSAVYTVLLIPLAFVVTTLALSGALGIGGDVFGDLGSTLAVTWGYPFAIGVAVDVFWMPAPDELDTLPQNA